jgi:cytoskeletal protein CcmA (bactofilin family)
MWKKDDARVVENSPADAASEIPAQTAAGNASAPRFSIPPLPDSSRASASISKGIRIVGEVTGSEDLFVDGTVEGNLKFENCSLTIGPNGNVRADISAREVIVRGKVEGKVSGRDRVALWGTGEIRGEVKTETLYIEEGGILRGKVEMGRPAPEVVVEPPVTPAAHTVEQYIEISTESVVE